MPVAVIPAQNEEQRIQKVIANLLQLALDKIIIVLNGSTDYSLAKILEFANPKIEILYFAEKLGLDVPRAIGAKRSLELQADSVLFVDGDMIGKFNPQLSALCASVQQELDLALTDCYPELDSSSSVPHGLLECRQRLNSKLDWFELLGFAIPSHGPHALSKRALQLIPLQDLAIPPMMLVQARKLNLKAGIAARIPHRELGSSLRGTIHAEMIYQTIYGDCLEAISVLDGRPRSRTDYGTAYQGYHPERNFDLLEEVVALPSLEKFVACSTGPGQV